MRYAQRHQYLPLGASTVYCVSIFVMLLLQCDRSGGNEIREGNQCGFRDLHVGRFFFPGEYGIAFSTLSFPDFDQIVASSSSVRCVRRCCVRFCTSHKKWMVWLNKIEWTRNRLVRDFLWRLGECEAFATARVETTPQSYTVPHTESINIGAAVSTTSFALWQRCAT